MPNGAPTESSFTCRIAAEADLPAIRALMARAIGELQTGFLTPQQVAASHHVMGLDTQLVRDGTYFIVESDGLVAGCGGWSWRATLYGGDASMVARTPAPLDPKTDAARIRAMYTDPAFTRRGVGRIILSAGEDAAKAHGFSRAEMMATLAGVPLYRACGYAEIEPVDAVTSEGVVVPMIRMGKPL